MLIRDIIQENWKKNITRNSGLEKQIADQIKRNKGMYVDQFSVGGHSITLNIDPMSPQDYRTSFTVNGDFTAPKYRERQGYRTTKRIFEGVLERLAAFMRVVEPRTISFSAGPEHQKVGRELAKIDLYIGILQSRDVERELRALGYRIDIDPVYRHTTPNPHPDDLHYVEFTIEKIDNSQ